uniref:Succinate-semialdehyde dehydrogenase (EC) n=1 Tax=Ganoderma boninense TaxID=34458 RepID=A0A5K1K5M4_9APHY|nr:Succinate-semialdehyde dehydrogenase (EC [Ganoderma boninense]
MPPPPLPICLPFFGGKKSRRRLTYSERSATEDYSSRRSSIDRLASGSYSPTATLTSHAEKLTFSSETESFDRSNTISNPQGQVLARHQEVGLWLGIGKKAKNQNQDDVSEKPHVQSPGSTPPPVYNSPPTETRSLKQTGSKATRPLAGPAPRPPTTAPSTSSLLPPTTPNVPLKSTTTKASGRSGGRPTLYPSESSSTLVGSALERKIRDEDPVVDRPDTTSRLDSLRNLMRTHDLDYYVIPSEDSHGSEYIAPHDKRREWISGFTGSAGQAVVSMRSAYLITDSRYWLQAGEQLDQNWVLVEAGGPSTNFKDWTEWLIDRAKDTKIGIDARLISFQAATALNNALKPKNSKLHYPPQNLVDLVWREKPARSREPIYVQPKEFTGTGAGEKLTRLRRWIKEQRPAMPSYSRSEPKPSQMQVATLIANLSSIAWLLNLRGDDIPFNPVFHSYLFVGLESATLFIEELKLTEEVKGYLQSIGIEWRDYNDLWTFLRRKEWGEGNVIISPQTSYAICLMMTSFRYTVLPSFVEDMKAVKNDVEIHGLRNAYLRVGAAYVRWLAWLEQKIQQGYDITEYEAAWRLTEYRRESRYYMGLAYENISATGPNAGESTAKMIERDTPYFNDSGGQYRDGTCDTTRTVHFGVPRKTSARPTRAFFKAILLLTPPASQKARPVRSLTSWRAGRSGRTAMHGTRHGFGSFLNVHEGPQSFSSDTVLVPRHVITNEPSSSDNANKWGMRVESALAVRRVKTKDQFNGDV